MSTSGVASRYLLVGGVCAVLNNVVLVSADLSGLRLPAAIGASFAIVCLAGYVMHCAVTFATPGSGPGLARYVLAMAAGLPLSATLLWFAVAVLRWPMGVAAPLTTGAMLIINFASSRWAIVRTAVTTQRGS